jgi:hypothetical protein
VFDVSFTLVLARVLIVSARRRFGIGLLTSAAGALLWAGLAAAGWYGRGADAFGASGAWLLVFFGPSAAPRATPAVPLSAALAEHPIGAKLVLAAVFLVPFTVAWRRAERLSPLSDDASALKKLGLVYLVPALLVLVQVVCVGMAMAAADSR